MIFDIIILSIGLLIRGIAIYQMKRNDIWRIIKPQVFQKEGIYNIVRHPMYLGTLLMFVPLWHIASNNLGTTAIFSIFVFSFVVDRIDREEQNMIFHYGEEYIEYMQKTKMLIPYIW